MLIYFGGFTFVRKWFVFVRRVNIYGLFLESLLFTNQMAPLKDPNKVRSSFNSDLIELGMMIFRVIYLVA